MDRTSDGKKTVYKTEFNKLCFLAYNKLEDDNEEVDLPLRWYQFGMEVCAPPGQLGVQFEPDSRGTKVTPKSLSQSAFEISGELRERIVQVAQRLADQYQHTYDTEAIVDESYNEFAPTEFVSKFHEFRSVLDELESGQPSLMAFDDSQSVDGHIETLRPHFEALVTSYPKDTYSEAYPEYRQWDSISRQLSKNGQIDQLKTFTATFWEMFSRVELQVNHNENIPASKKAEWIRGRDEERDNFAEVITEFRSIALDQYSDSSYLDEVAEQYSDVVRNIAQNVSE